MDSLIRNRVVQLKSLSSLARLFYPFGVSRRVFAGPAKGLRFVVKPGFGLTYAFGWDAFNLDFLSSKIRRDTVVYDIGANRGQTTIAFAKFVGAEGKVVSFEPVPELYEDLLVNTKLNSQVNVEAVNAAVSDQVGTSSFCFYEDLPTVGRLQELERFEVETPGVTLEVETTTVDAFQEQSNTPPDFLKIDVEGAAASVLKGARQVIEKHSPDIYIEVHSQSERDAIIEHLLPYGYHLESLAGVAIEDPTKTTEDTFWCRCA